MKFILSLLISSVFVSAVAAQNFNQNNERNNYTVFERERVGKKILPSAYDKNAKNIVSESKDSSAPFPQTTPYVRPTKEKRFKRYLSDSFGVPAIIGSAFGAGISQISNNPPEWKRTAGGYGRRFASSYGANMIRNTISYGLNEAFRLDNRFEKSGQKNFGKRLKHVFLASYTTRTKDGSRIPDFPHFVGTYSASVIANEAWMPDRFSYKDGLRSGTISLGTRFGVNLLREFFWK